MLDWVNLYLNALSDEELKDEIIPGRNHGIFLLGHLVASDDDLSLYINKDPMLFPEYQKLFKQGATCLPLDQYPSANELREAWKKVCEKNVKLFSDLKDEYLDQSHEMIQGNPDEDYFITKERVLINWIFHQLHMAGELAVLLGKHGRRLV